MNTSDESADVTATNNSMMLPGKMTYQLDEFYLDLQEDGNHIRLLSPEEIKESPFPGLRPYRTSEFQLFKGRGGQAEDLIDRLQHNKFLAVIGSSGTGKSSLVRAGLIPQLFGGYLHGTGSRWDVAICRPGADPIENLSIALASIQTGSRNKEGIGLAFEDIYQKLIMSIYGLLDVSGMLNEGREADKKRNLLVIIDQFEELFRFTSKSGLLDGHQTQFVNLLLKAAATPENPVYVITTMRSEFLGDCVRFQGLPEAINKGQYLVPQLDRPQLKEVIEDPLALAGKAIAPGLIEMLINKIDENKLKDNLDQLPILQHALMRSYQQSAMNTEDEEIVYDDYKAVGGMEESLSRHANDKFRELGDGDEEDGMSKKQQIAKLIFQSLTDQSLGGQKGGRRPLPLHQIYELCSSIPADTDEVNAVIEHFRAADTSFLMPPPSTPLSPDLIIDISHESLMRNWTELQTWINEETLNGKLYTRLNERRELYEKDNQDVIKGVLLRELTELKGKIKITAAWASRYHRKPQDDSEVPDHELLKKENLAFLEYSIQREETEASEQKLKLEEEVRTQERERIRKIRMFALSIALAVTVGLAIWAISLKVRADRSLVKEIASRKAAEKAEETTKVYYAAINEANAKLSEKEHSLSEQVNKNKLLADSLKVKSEEIASQKKAIELQLTINSLQKEHFYKLNGLGDGLKGGMMKDVLKGKLDRSGNVNVQQYIDQNKLTLFNKAAVAFDTIPANAILGLRMADTLWRLHSENRYLRQIIGRIFETNLFPDNTRYFGDEESLRISLAEHDGFYIIGSDSLYALSYNPDNSQLGIRRAFGINPQPFGWQAYSLVGNNQFLTLVGGKLINWNAGRELVLDSIPPPTYAVFASRSRQLITSFQDTIKLWDLDSMGGRKMRPKVLTTKRDVIGLTVSPDGNKLLIQAYESNEVWDLSKASRLSRENGNLQGVNGVGFTPKGDQLLVAKGNSIFLSNLEGDRLDGFTWSLPNNSDLDYEYLKIDKLILSADWKKIILLSGGGAFLIESNDGSILHSTSTTNHGSSGRGLKTNYIRNGAVKARRFSNGNILLKDAQFIGPSYAAMTDERGQLSLWNTLYDWNVNISESLNRLKTLTKLTEDEKLESGRLRYEDIQHSNDLRLVRKSAFYFLKKTEDDYDGYAKIPNEELAKIKALFRHALDLDHTGRRAEAIRRLTAINLRMIFNIKGISLSDYSEKAKLSSENVNLYDEFLTIVPNNLDVQRLLASSYGSLSFYKIFEQDYAGAIAAANKGLKLNGDAIWIYTNLALGNLLKGNYAEAEKLYSRYMNEKYDGRLIKESFLEDFEKVEETKIIKGDEPDVIKIKQLLSSNKSPD